jgi:hypothetical protein
VVDSATGQTLWSRPSDDVCGARLLGGGTAVLWSATREDHVDEARLWRRSDGRELLLGIGKTYVALEIPGSVLLTVFPPGDGRTAPGVDPRVHQVNIP